MTSRFLINPNQLTYHHVSSLSAVDLELWSQLKFDGLTFVACAIMAIWKIHWRQTFDPEDFWPLEAAAHATALLRRIHDANAAIHAKRQARRQVTP